jgi:hypothetical protein
VLGASTQVDYRFANSLWDIESLVKDVNLQEFQGQDPEVAWSELRCLEFWKLFNLEVKNENIQAISYFIQCIN